MRGGNYIESSSGFLPINESCVSCLQPITNPMCVECYLKHVHLWLLSQGMTDVESRVVQDYIRKELPESDFNSDVCVVCNKENLSVCSYCFVFLASVVLNKLNFAGDFKEDFKYLFSYKGGDYN